MLRGATMTNSDVGIYETHAGNKIISSHCTTQAIKRSNLSGRAR